MLLVAGSNDTVTSSFAWSQSVPPIPSGGFESACRRMLLMVSHPDHGDPFHDAATGHAAVPPPPWAGERVVAGCANQAADPLERVAATCSPADSSICRRKLAPARSS
jgi:hypothetical protein